MIGSSKRVLSSTKNEDKIKSIKEGVAILEDFLDEFEKEGRSKLNMAYLSYDIIKQLPKPVDSLMKEFLDCYGNDSKGNYKHLRTRAPEDDDSVSWDIIRNKKLLELKADAEDKDLFHSNGKPTEIHLDMIYWAYSPSESKLKKYCETLNKRKSSADDECAKKVKK